MSKTLETLSLAALADKFIPQELGILSQYLSKILALGIDPKNNQAQYAPGMYATTFILPKKEIVIKFFDKEPEEPAVAKLPNQSRYILQPFCHTSIAGNRLMIFPMLDTERVQASHINYLEDHLKEEGYEFDDRKAANIALTSDGHPYVIDEDAVKIIPQGGQTASQLREEQWRIIKPLFKTDRAVDFSQWEFAPEICTIIDPAQSVSPAYSARLSGSKEATR